MEMDNPDQSYISGESQTYAEDRRKRRRHRRVVGYLVCVALWLLSAVPLARLSGDEGGGADVVAAFLAVGLALAVIIRGIYARRTRRSFWSPWLFVIAAVLAISSYGVQSAGEKVPSASVEWDDEGGASHWPAQGRSHDVFRATQHSAPVSQLW